MTSPSSYLVFDPGRKMGYASCLRGGEDLRYGTWKLNHEPAGAAYSAFLNLVTPEIKQLPDVQVGIELMTIVPHEDEKGRANVDAQQVMFSSGWPTILQTICFRLEVREPELIAIPSWRSRTHGKVRAPAGMKASDRGKFFKQAAFDYCHGNGWTPDSDNAAEALCMLDYLRILHEPEFAFDRGKSHHQESLFA